MNLTIGAITQDLRQRLEMLAPSAFFASVAGTRRLDPLDPVILGFAALRLMYENMLQSRQTRIDDIEALVAALAPRYLGERPAADRITRWAQTLLIDLLQNGGKPWEFRWRDPIDGREVAVPVRLIAVDRDFKVGAPSAYRLTTQGLGFLFQTREFRMEAMVTVEQLFLRRQLEKGNFAGAMQRLGALSVLIQQLDREMQEMAERATLNALLIPFDRYADLHARIYDHFEQEQLEFMEQRRLAIERRTILEKPGTTQNERDREALEWLRRIERRLDQLIGEHRSLFLRKQQLQQAYRNALENQFANGFRSRLNPEAELLDVLLRGTHPLPALTGSFRPFLPPSLPKRFNPWRCFSEWAVKADGRPDREETLDDAPATQDDEERLERERLRRLRCSGFLRRLLAALRRTSPLRLSELLREIPHEERADLTRSFELYQLLIMLHQAGTIDLARLGREPARVLGDAEEVSLERLFFDLLCEDPDLPARMEFEAKADGTMLSLDDGIELTDFCFTLETGLHAAPTSPERGF